VAAPSPPQQTRLFRSLASTLIRRTITVAAVVAIIAAIAQAFITLSEEQEKFERTLRNIAETNVPLLSVSLWDIEPAAVKRQLRQIASQPEIAYVRLAERTGHTFEDGNRGRVTTEKPKVLEIPYPDGRAGTIGTLEVTANRATLYQHVAERVVAVFVGYGLLAFALCGVIAVVLRLELERPMRELTRFTSELTPGTLTTPLKLTRPQRRWHDEIDLLAQGFRTLQDGIQAHVTNLDSQVKQRTVQLESALDEIRALTITDPLTGCYNRRYLDERLREEVLRSQRSGRPLSLIVADIDHFKQVNDTLGHPAGDCVLKGMAEILLSEMRAQIDWVARLGGEEFVVLLPDTELEAAGRVAERLRLAVEATTFMFEKHEIHVTASFGVAARVESDTAASLLGRADAMLYKAKAANRNAVVVG
jgi:two-component system, cell cycle response regulator